MKMKRSYLLLAVAATLLAGCTQTPKSYEVKGTLPDASFDGKMIYIRSYDESTNVDSTTIEGQNFVFTGTIDQPIMARIDVERTNYVNFILENGTIDLDFETHLGSPTTPLNTKFNAMTEEINTMIKSYQAKVAEIREEVADQKEQQERIQAYFQDEFRAVYLGKIKDYFLANSDNPVGYRAFIEYSNMAEPAELEELIPQVGPWLAETKAIKRVITQNEALKKTAEGMPFVDFTIETEEGGKVSLSDYVGKGKYVLVDFWASWCGPCIQETPIIAEVYNKYKGDKFEVLGVAVWDELEKTKEAIPKHDITWPQILNAQSIPTDLYGVSGIPHIILFGPDGKIVKRNLRGEALKNAVAEAMEGK
ncbi:thiol-disulfide isomerase/thioredoxin [Parabacteroides sp. PFB2-12]|nr:thiol-disulfide isomerase/thioredoxin [Parabacteroides sp. PM6-13]MDH6391091.1 thiol-disulfide isomerase/thioredoxin [Parabacteroides sp. PFB2-12]